MNAPGRGKNVVPAILELALLLVAVPLLVALAPVHMPHLPLLLAGCFYALWRLRGGLAWKRLWSRPPPGWWHGPLLRAVLAGAALSLLLLLKEPEQLFSLPRHRPLIWVLVMILYPLLSVLPQEIIYRLFLFRTLERLGAGPWLTVPASAALFGWVHIIYAGNFAMVSSCIAGLALGWNYLHNQERPGALWPLLLEHALYGQLVFTLGLGRYFYLPR